MNLPPVWLASASPRRQSMLGWMNLEFKIQAAEIDESLGPGELPMEYVSRLAREKAAAASKKIRANGLILAADTAVVLNRDILGKPLNKGEAEKMLKALRNQSHQVITALILLETQQAVSTIETCTSIVHMRNYSDDEISKYVESGDALDKAGAYAIQHPQFNPVDNLIGCYASVMGLPLCHLERNLRKFSDYQPVPINAVCQKFLDYTCPIHQRILDGENIT